jgi:CheY-like chemotaxis protein
MASGLHILMVEDDADSAYPLLRLLRMLGHEVRAADCVRSALLAADTGPLDLLIADLGLPDGSGLELMRTLCARRPVKGIALTGHALEDDIDEAIRAGFGAHLTKPVEFSRLVEAIGSVCGDVSP